MPSPLWFVVLNYNGLDDTRTCLESLAAVREQATVLVVDNASEVDPAPELRDAFPWARFHRNPTNEGYAGGNNRGVEIALGGGASHVALLNNDTRVAPRIAARLEEAARSHPAFGIIGPVISYMEEPGVIRTDGCLFNLAAQPGFFHRLEVPPRAPADAPRVEEVDIVNGCCLMAARSVFERIGLIDERFFLVHEESDFCLRAQRAGFKCGVLADVLVWHKGSSTFKRAGNGLQRYFDVRNLSLLLREHPRANERQRNATAAWFEYLKYAYYVYARERESGTSASARAVVNGLHDALTRSYGPPVSRSRPLAGMLQLVLESKRRLPLGRAS
jgi:hypothetical protein